MKFSVRRSLDIYVAPYTDFNVSVWAEKRNFLCMLNLGSADAQPFRLFRKQNAIQHQVNVINSGHMYNAFHPARKSFRFCH
ncbi:hypothetical protein PANTOEA_21840, partial [Pantoea dispersa]|uniref:hypothetical protein n=1 Tax=Pantoea dispersa TaxID=59814 RepID=UPI0032B3F8F8